MNLRQRVKVTCKSGVYGSYGFSLSVIKGSPKMNFLWPGFRPGTWTRACLTYYKVNNEQHQDCIGFILQSLYIVFKTSER